MRLGLPPDSNLPDSFGFRSGDRGTHTSRTMMLAELTMLLAAMPADATAPDYRSAIVVDNVLAKRTESTRKLTAQRMSELYALAPRVPVFRILRELWDASEEGRPLLACLCANARDPILRITAPPVLQAELGERVSKHTIAEVVGRHTGDRFNSNTLDKIARNAASSWTQSGHLQGRYHKTRTRPVVTPADAAYALVLGRLSGARGQALFDTYWTALVDVPSDRLDALAFEASRRGWLDYRRVGGVVDVGFAGLLTDRELEELRG